MSGKTEKSLRYPVSVLCSSLIKISMGSKNEMKFQNTMALRDRTPRRDLKHTYTHIPQSK